MASRWTDVTSDTLPGGVLTVDLAAIAANWRDLASRVAGETGAVVKANAYGTGIETTVSALREAGCRTFFVALLDEAKRARAAAPDATVYVLNGLPVGREQDFVALNARPVLGSLDEIEAWAAFSPDSGEKPPSAIHIDTGMTRLGLERDEVDAVANRPDLIDAAAPALLMSHFSCADDFEHPLNRLQIEAFSEARAKLPDLPASFANSAATLTRPDAHLDLARPGVAIFGGRAVNDAPNPMRPVVRVDVPIIQTRGAKAGETVGYGAAETLGRDSRIAIVMAGYADGYLRASSSSDGHPGGFAMIGDHRAPIVGRVSMDLIALDVTEIPEPLTRRGMPVQLIGPDVDVDVVADAAGTIGYEILTSLGRRYERRFMGVGD